MTADPSESLADLGRMRQTERRAALATLIATVGTTPKKEGATMWVGQGGRILGSVTIGGCVDAQVIAEADEVISGLRSKRLSLSLRDEEGWDLGLTCGGTLEVLVEPVRFDADADPVVAAHHAVSRALTDGRRIVTVASLAGEPARLLVCDDGTVAGTLGSSALDAAARSHALELLERGNMIRSGAIATLTPPSDTDARTPTELFFQLHAPLPHLLIFGATHVAMPLVASATLLGWRTTVIDARPRFATRERFPDATEIRVGNVGELAAAERYDASTYVVIVTHDYKFELPILRTVLAEQPAYIGLLAGHARARALREFVAADGLDAAALDRIHMPIGLDLGAQSAAEIALAIMAEILAVRSGHETARGAKR